MIKKFRNVLQFWIGAPPSTGYWSKNAAADDLLSLETCYGIDICGFGLYIIFPLVLPPPGAGIIYWLNYECCGKGGAKVDEGFGNHPIGEGPPLGIMPWCYGGSCYIEGDWRPKDCELVVAASGGQRIAECWNCCYYCWYNLSFSSIWCFIKQIL